MRWLILFLLAAPLSAATYDVGPGQTYTSIGAAPWATLAPGDVVRIHYRATPYAEKWVICRQGAAGNPITIQGVPEAGTGNLPVITGENAITAPGLNYWNEPRGIIKVGGANTPADTMPQYIVIENLIIRSAHPNYSFTDDSSATVTYAGNAAAIFVEKANHLTIRNCTLHDSGNGLFIAPGGGVGSGTLTENITVTGCYIHGNGINGSAFEHNSYCEAHGITYEYNRYGPLRSGANGNALKDRGAGTVIRYNWIESGNRQIDLVEAYTSGIQNLPAYSSTYVYGNILIEPDGAGNSQIIHYGGDNGTTSNYRKGTLYLYNNTIYSTRAGNTTLIRMSTNDETCDCRNNIVFVTANASNLGLIDNTGTLNYRNCFFKGTPTNSHSGGSATGTVNNLGGNVTGTSAGFLNEAGQDFTLATGSTCRDAGAALHASVLPTHNANRIYVKHQQNVARFADATFDIGAYEFDTGVPATPPATPTGLSAVATTTLGATVTWTDTSNNETGFRIERQQGAGAFATAGTVGAGVTTFNDSGLTDGQQYTYRVFAYNPAGDSTASNTSTITADNSGAGGGGGGGGGGGSSGGGGGCAAAGGAGAISLALLALLGFARTRE